MYTYISATLMALTSVSLMLCNLPLISTIYENSKPDNIFQITVSAGSIDRTGSIISFPMPDNYEAGNYLIESDAGMTKNLQIDNNNIGWMIIEKMEAGESLIFKFSGKKISRQGETPATATLAENTISLKSDGREILQFFHDFNIPPEPLDERYRRGGYIHPVRTPSGAILTDHLNPNAHSHHSGIWSAWTSTEFQGRNPDFWNLHQNSGRVDIDTLLGYWSGTIFAGIESINKYTDLSSGEPVMALLEHWELRGYSFPGSFNFHIFDLVITQNTQAGNRLFLPEYRYGGIGFRGHRDWGDNPDSTIFLTSDGLGREGHGTRARWCHIGGLSEGKRAGIAILGHPSNFRFPQTMRIHPSEPFFNYAPTQLAPMSIEPGKPHVIRQRFITYDGEPDSKLIEQLWNDYAYPAGVTIIKLD